VVSLSPFDCSLSQVGEKEEERDRCYSFVLSLTPLETYIPLTLYPLRGSRDVSDIPPRHPSRLLRHPWKKEEREVPNITHKINNDIEHKINNGPVLAEDYKQRDYQVDRVVVGGHLNC
jgi:hypothetical protein